MSVFAKYSFHARHSQQKLLAVNVIKGVDALHSVCIVQLQPYACFSCFEYFTLEQPRQYV